MDERLREAWIGNYSRLEEFQATHGHVRLPCNDPQYRHLLRWLQRQCFLARRQRLPPEYRERLVRLGVTWLDAPLIGHSREERSRRQAERRAAFWNRMFGLLEDFKRRFGHCRVPTRCEFRTLYVWLRLERAKARRQALPATLRQRLADLGVIFKLARPGQPRPAQWELRFAQLLEYKKRFGHARVPKGWPENPALGNWLSWQRTLAKKGMLTPERLQRLLEVGFTWQVQHLDQQPMKGS